MITSCFHEKQNKVAKNDDNQDVTLFGGKFMKSVEKNCGAVGQKDKDCKIKNRQIKMAETMIISKK
jgi:hypothetical protein